MVRKREQGSHVDYGEKRDCFQCLNDTDSTPQSIVEYQTNHAVSQAAKGESIESRQQLCLIWILEKYMMKYSGHKPGQNRLHCEFL